MVNVTVDSIHGSYGIQSYSNQVIIISNLRFTISSWVYVVNPICHEVTIPEFDVYETGHTSFWDDLYDDPQVRVGFHGVVSWFFDFRFTTWSSANIGMFPSAVSSPRECPPWEVSRSEEHIVGGPFALAAGAHLHRRVTSACRRSTNNKRFGWKVAPRTVQNPK